MAGNSPHLNRSSEGPKELDETSKTNSPDAHALDLSTSSRESPTKKPALKVFQCLFCGAPVELRALGEAICVVCQACGSIIDTTNENYRILSAAKEKLSIEPMIPIGQRGTLQGHLWEVIGFMRRCDWKEEYFWDEYLLFNPIRGFRWLTEAEGHWNYVTMIKEKPQVHQRANQNRRNQRKAPKVLMYLDTSYPIFHAGKAKVVYVMGEFYWRVQVGDVVEVQDYIAPPRMLSCEKNEEEIIWSVGEYVPAQEVQTAFQITKPMPTQKGVAPNQPSKIGALSSSLRRYFFLFATILCALQALHLFLAKKEQVYQGNFIYRANDPEKVKISPSFELKYGRANVDFQLYAPLTDSWLEIGVDLINEKTGVSYEFQQGIEYYSGTDSDGPWTSGERQTHVILSAIPAGTYHLVIEASGPALGVSSASAALSEGESIQTFASTSPATSEAGPIPLTESAASFTLQGIKPHPRGLNIDSPPTPVKDPASATPTQSSFSPGPKVDPVTAPTPTAVPPPTGATPSAGAPSPMETSSQPTSVPSIEVAPVPAPIDPGPGQEYTFTVTRSVVTWWNFFVGMFLLTVIPVVVWVRKQSFERSRWENSMFSPFSSEEYGKIACFHHFRARSKEQLMKKFFIVYGIILCVGFASTSFIGLDVIDFIRSKTWGPHVFHPDPGSHHK